LNRKYILETSIIFCKEIFMSRLSTHVLDTAIGVPAVGIKIELFSIDGDQRKLIKEVLTNSDGRTNEPILDKEEFFLGNFELIFHVGGYLTNRLVTPDNLQGLLYDLIPVRFKIFSHRNYHIPLLLSPFGYSTYLGS